MDKVILSIALLFSCTTTFAKTTGGLGISLVVVDNSESRSDPNHKTVTTTDSTQSKTVDTCKSNTDHQEQSSTPCK